MPEPVIDTQWLRAAPLICGLDTPGPGFRYHRPQGVEDFSLVLTLGGGADVGTARQKWAQRAGDLLLIEPRHAIYQETSHPIGWPRLWAIFAPRLPWREWLDWPELAPGFRQLHLPRGGVRNLVRTQLASMYRHASGTRRRRHEQAMNALEAALLECDSFNPHNPQASLDPRVVAAVEFIGQNLRRRFKLDEIAEAAGLSVPHLNRLFRRQIEASPMGYIERQRMQRAVELLSMGRSSIADVAAGVGFDDALYFSKRFKRYSGMSPRLYRRAGRLTTL